MDHAITIKDVALASGGVIGVMLVIGAVVFVLSIIAKGFRH
jgi:hypothetical protein